MEAPRARFCFNARKISVADSPQPFANVEKWWVQTRMWERESFRSPRSQLHSITIDASCRKTVAGRRSKFLLAMVSRPWSTMPRSQRALPQTARPPD